MIWSLVPAWIYDPAKVASKIDREKWKASLTFQERLMYKLFTLFRFIAPPPTYDRKQVTEMIISTDFKEYSFEEEDYEMRIKLRKKGDANGC